MKIFKKKLVLSIEEKILDALKDIENKKTGV